MAENTVNEATRSLIQSLRESNQAIVDSAVAAQERNAKFAQSVLENGIEVLKSHAESTRSLTHTLLEQSQNQREAFRTLAQESIEAYGKFFTSPTTYLERALEMSETFTRQGVEGYQKVAHQAKEKSQKATA